MQSELKTIILNAIDAKSKKYPWMETFFITDEEIIESSGQKLPKRTLNQALKSMKPVLKLHESQFYKGRRIHKYAFNSWKLGEKVSTKRNLNNPQFIHNAMLEFVSA